MLNSKKIKKTNNSDPRHQSSRKKMEKKLSDLEVKRKKEELVASLFSRLIIRPFSSIEPVKGSNTKVIFPMKAVKTIDEIKDEVVKKAVESTKIKEEVIAAKKTEQEFVLTDESEKESLPIEEETTLLDEDENKESIELIEKEKEIKAEIESKVEVDVKSREEI